MGQMVELGPEHVRPRGVLGCGAQPGLEPARTAGARDLGPVSTWRSGDSPGRGRHGLGEGAQLLGRCREVTGILLGAPRALLSRISPLYLSGGEPERLANIPLGKGLLNLPEGREARSV